MTTFYKKFEDVNEGDLQVLKDSGEIEGLQLEFKREISHLTSLVEEVVSFANTKGGDLFIGIGENQNGSNELNGVDEVPDKAVLRFKQAIENKTDPRLINVLYRPIPLSNGKHVIHIRVPRSWNAPHMVKENNRFMIRTGSAKIAAATSEIRSMMDQRSHFSERYERFRVQRIEKSLNVYHQAAPFIMIHYVPVSAFDINSNHPVIERRQLLNTYVLGGATANPQINVNGLYNQLKELNYRAHTQIFRNGIIEQVSNYPFSHSGNETNLDEPMKFFVVSEFEESFKDSIKRQISNYASIDMADPFYIFVSMVGSMGVVGSRRAPVWFKELASVDEDMLHLPEILLESKEDHVIEEVVNAVCKSFWNAVGFAEKPAGAYL
ncbi:helix-turn-helix domain-containing protein [Paenibacillus glucanolyticus]|uniref:helix-turn-helix domain-containing protein n=1 Tax=Paenibacillus glucanolyticus TaxID=59843 RepID=UPI0034CF1825